MKRLPSLLLVSIGILLSQSAQAASFDCAKAATSTEKAICADPEISALDSQLMSAYKDARSHTSNADALKLEQLDWLRQTRNQCADSACLKAAYTDRIAALAPPPSEAAKASEEAPSTPVAETPQPAAQTAQTAPSSPQARNPDAAAAAADAGAAPVKPDAGASGVFNSIYTFLVALFLVGLVKPRWVLRWDPSASRKKILACFLAAAVPIGILGELTKSKATRQYEASMRAEREKQKELLAANQRAANERAASERAAKDNVHQVAQKAEWRGTDGQRKFRDEVVAAESLIRTARSLGKDEGACEEQIEKVKHTVSYESGKTITEYQQYGQYENGLAIATVQVHNEALALQSMCNI